jgi:hypothetical protein
MTAMIMPTVAVKSLLRHELNSMITHVCGLWNTPNFIDTLTRDIFLSTAIEQRGVLLHKDAPYFRLFHACVTLRA